MSARLVAFVVAVPGLESLVLAEVQKAGGVAAYIDAENALDPVYAGKLGVNVGDLLISQPDTGEQCRAWWEREHRDVVQRFVQLAPPPEDDTEGDTHSSDGDEVDRAIAHVEPLPGCGCRTHH